MSDLQSSAKRAKSKSGSETQDHPMPLCPESKHDENQDVRIDVDATPSLLDQIRALVVKLQQHHYATDTATTGVQLWKTKVVVEIHTNNLKDATDRLDLLLQKDAPDAEVTKQENLVENCRKQLKISTEAMNQYQTYYNNCQLTWKARGVKLNEPSPFNNNSEEIERALYNQSYDEFHNLVSILVNRWLSMPGDNFAPGQSLYIKQGDFFYPGKILRSMVEFDEDKSVCVTWKIDDVAVQTEKKRVFISLKATEKLSDMPCLPMKLSLVDPGGAKSVGCLYSDKFVSVKELDEWYDWLGGCRDTIRIIP